MPSIADGTGRSLATSSSTASVQPARTPTTRINRTRAAYSSPTPAYQGDEHQRDAAPTFPAGAAASGAGWRLHRIGGRPLNYDAGSRAQPRLVAADDVGRPPLDRR